MDLDKSLKILLILIASIVINYLGRKRFKLPIKLETKRARTLISLIQSVISITIFVLGIILVLSVLEIDISPILASAGIIGIAVGFGSQTLVKDLIAGLFLLAEDSISIGDFVEIEGNRGFVQKINIRTIILKDETGALRIIPAGKITEIVNFSREEAKVNIDLPFKINVKVDEIFKILRDELNQLSSDKRFTKIITHKPELKGVEEILPGKILVRSIIYCKANKQWRIKREFLYRIKKRFEKEIIEFA